MRRLVLILAVSLLVVSMTSCASSGSGEEDGLHSTVPDVVGLDEAAARTELEEAGYTVGGVSTESATDAKPGTVVKQDPIASTSLPREAEVDIVIADP